MRDTVQEFFELFTGNERVHGTYDVEGTDSSGKKQGSARTIKTSPATKELWAAHLSGKKGIGVVPIMDDNTCLFAAIDIDSYDGLDHAELARKLLEHDLPLTVCRSKSGGAHLYIFTKANTPASTIQSKLREVAAFIGYGTSEIFPKQTKILAEQGDVGNWINMPYFGGMSGLRYAVKPDGDAMSPEEFIDHAQTNLVGEEWFSKLLVIASASFMDGPPCLQTLGSLGFPQGTRNSGLMNVALFLKKSRPDDWKNHVPVYNLKFMKPPLSNEEVQGVLKSADKKKYNYTCQSSPINAHCQAALCRTKKYGVGEDNIKLPEFGSLTKIDVVPPIWFLTVGNHRVELKTEELQEPRLFQRRCMESANMVVPQVSRAVWDGVLRQLMLTISIVDAPDDIKPEGRFTDYLEKFCTQRAQAKQEDEILLGKPWTADGKTYFRASDLIDFLAKKKFGELQVNRMASILKQNGAEHKRKNMKGVGVNLWSVPAFVQQSESHEIPAELDQDAPPF